MSNSRHKPTKRSRGRADMPGDRQFYFVRLGNDGVDDTDEASPELVKAIEGQALKTIAILIAGFERLFGLVIQPSRRAVGEYSYHWHSPDGDCHSDQAVEGFTSLTAAVMGGVAELAHVASLSGEAPLVIALQAAGLDLTGMASMLPPELDDHERAEIYAKALALAFGTMQEAARTQTSGFAGPLVGSFLAVIRNLVDGCGEEAHAIVAKENPLMVPGVLPPGFVAVPAQMIVGLELLIQQMDGTESQGDSNDPRSRTTTISA